MVAFIEGAASGILVNRASLCAKKFTKMSRSDTETRTV